MIFDKDIIIKLKNSIDFEQLLYVLEFKNINVIKNRSSCLLHDGDNVSSFSWNDETFYCFACLAQGDKIKLIELTKGFTFKQAVKFLAKLTGIELRDSQDDNKKKIDYSKMEFSTALAEAQARKTLLEYYDTTEIESEIETYSKILYSLRNDNLPELYKQVKQILNDLDEQLSYTIHQRRRIDAVKAVSNRCH